MKKPDIPANEPARVAALCGLNILDTLPEERFDRITRIAQRHFQVPIALVSLVDVDRQWFKSRQGLDVTETPRGISFCGHAILSEDVFYIPDALNDPRFADNPLVTGGPKIRFYAGAPLHSVEGERIGTLCIIDDKPRQFTPEEFSVLRDLAGCVEAELERTHLLYSAEELGRFKYVLDSTLDMIFMFDSETLQFNYLNMGAIKSMGYTKDELLQMHPYDIKPEIPQDVFLKLIEPLFSGRDQVLNFETVHRRKDGTDFPVAITLQLVREVNGAGRFVAVVHDITDRKANENMLRDAEQSLRAVIETVVDGIVTIDDQGAVHTFNPAAERIFGYQADEVVGRNVKMLMPESYAREHDGYLHNYLTTGVKKVIGIGREVTGMHKDGSTFPMELAVSEMEIKGERMFTGIVRDITERKRIEKMKSEFVSTVSHELRTPLTSIRGALGLVLGTAAAQLPEQSQHLLEMASRNSERLSMLINDILDLEKIEGGRLEFELKPVDLVTLAEQALEDNEGFASQHKTRLVLNKQVNSAPVWADEHRILQVFANLISNAVKYSPEGGEVTVSVTTHNGDIRVLVRDCGAGIPEEFRNRIFQRFAQADSSDTREKGGTGLGLSITKAIVERHRGSIGYDSQAGAGTMFYFDLPARHAVIEHAKTASKNANSVRVLICEDNPDVARILAGMVEPEGAMCDIASSAASARDLLARHDYCLMLLDLTLPDADGLTLLQSLRENPATEQLPIIVVSGRAEEGRASFTGDAVTVVDWIQKPVEKQRLERALKEALSHNLRPRILHVEDDMDVVQVTNVLVDNLAVLTHVDSLRRARQLLAEQTFDLVILDLGLADGPGVALLDELKGRCPVVIFSAQTPGREITEQVAAALTKSVTSNEQLLDTIKKALSGKPEASNS